LSDTWFIGIDPGKTGALAAFNDDYTEHEIIPFSEVMYLGFLESVEFCNCLCCLEEVHSMPGQGVASTFSFGKNYGFIKGLLTAVKIPYQEVKPQTWKKEFGLNSDKKKSVEVAQHLFPNWDLRRSAKCRKDDDNIAEALLMAEYARRNFGKEKR